MKEEQMDNKDISPAYYWLALCWKIFLLTVPQHPYCILVTMCITEKCSRPSHFCITWVVSTHLYSYLQTPSLPFLPISCVFPAFLFQCLSKSIVSRTMIAIVFPGFLVLIGCIIQKLSHNRKTFKQRLPNFMFVSHPAS